MKKISFLMLLILAASVFTFTACDFELSLGGDDYDDDAEEVVSEETEEGEELEALLPANTYQDDYLSFEYPKGVELYASNDASPALYHRTMNFMVWDVETGSYDTAGIQMKYVYLLNLAEYGMEAEYDYEGLMEAYENSDMEPWGEDVPVYEEFDFGDRTGFIVRSVGMGAGYYVDMYIPFLGDGEVNPYHVYKISRNSLSFDKEAVEEIISLFVETAVFHQ